MQEKITKIKNPNKFIQWWKSLKTLYKGLIIGGAVAVTSTAVVVPIVAINNSHSFNGALTEAEWKNALTSQTMKLNHDSNLKCTVKATSVQDAANDCVINILNGRSTLHYIRDNKYTYSLLTEYGIFENSHMNEKYRYLTSYRMSEMQISFFDVFNDCVNDFSKFTFDSKNKEYQLKDETNAYGFKIKKIKFNSNKNISESIIDILEVEYKYTFEYGKATMIDFPPPEENSILTLNYDETGSQGTTISHDYNDGSFPCRIYLIDLAKLTQFNVSNKIELGFQGFDFETYKPEVIKVSIVDKILGVQPHEGFFENNKIIFSDQYLEWRRDFKMVVEVTAPKHETSGQFYVKVVD